MRILIVGRPGVGKTTAVIKTINHISTPVRGFYTQEIREKRGRVGFLLKTLNGKQEILAHINSSSQFHVGKYGVNTKLWDKLIPLLIPQTNNEIIVIDEIGKMECLCQSFRTFILNIIKTENSLLATAPLKGTSFIENIKHKFKIIEINVKNRDIIPLQLKEMLKR